MIDRVTECHPRPRRLAKHNLRDASRRAKSISESATRRPFKSDYLGAEVFGKLHVLRERRIVSRFESTRFFVWRFHINCIPIVR